MNRLITRRACAASCTLLALVAALFIPTLSSGAAGQSSGFSVSGLSPEDAVTFNGSGWGHGVGMSHFGMKSLAAAGNNAANILGFYYPGTTLTSGWDRGDLRILLGTATGSSRFRPRGPFSVTVDGNTIYESTQSELFTVGLSNGTWTSVTSGGVDMCPSGGCTGSVFRILTADGVPKETSVSKRSYSHGQMELTKRSGSNYRVVLVELPLEDYLKGIAEVPVYWPTESLRAQAIASRTYALYITARRRSDSGWTYPFDLYDNTYHQVYVGNDREAASNSGPWLNAVRDTTGIAVTYENKPILATFTTSNGGYLEASGYAFSRGISYLVSKPDPNTNGDPYLNWSRTYRISALSRWLSRFGDTSVGTLNAISVSGNISASGRIDRAAVRLSGSTGTKTISGARFVNVINSGASADGLRELPTASGQGGHLLSTKLSFGTAAPNDLPPEIASTPQANPLPPPAAPVAPPKVVTPPSQPQNLQLNTFNRELEARWNAPANHGGGDTLTYVVQWRPQGGSLKSHETSSTSVRIGGLTNGANYEVFVTTRNEAGTSPTVRITGTPVGPPGPPRSVELSRGNQYLDVSWQPPSQDGGRAVTGYEVSWQASGGLSAAASTSSLGYRIENLKNGVNYTVKVTAANDVGASSSSETRQGTPARTPDVPRSLRIESHDGHLHANWQPPENNGGLPIGAYLLTISSAGGQASTYEIEGGSTSHEVSDLTNGVAYSIQLAARNAVGTSPQSESATATPVGPPSSPQSLFVSRGDGRISVSWAAPEDNGGLAIRDYEITWKPASEVADEAPGGSQRASDTARDFIIEGLSNGVTYTVSVIANNEAGPSAPSEGHEATPAGIPGAPRQLMLSGGDQRIDATWERPEDDGGAGVVGYRITWQPSEEPSAAPVSVQVEEPGYTIEGLLNGVAYSVSVSTINEVGGSVASEELRSTPMTTPGAPSSLAIAPKPNSLELTWLPPAEDGGGTISSYTLTWTPLSALMSGSEMSGSEEIGEENEDTTRQVEVAGVGFILSDLEVDTTYLISLRANNEAGASRLVSVVEAGTRAGETPAESVLAVEAPLEIEALTAINNPAIEPPAAETLRERRTPTSSAGGGWSPSNGIASLTLAGLSVLVFGTLFLLSRALSFSKSLSREDSN